MYKYSKSFKIPYFDVDRNKRLTSLALLKYFSEISVNHVDDYDTNVEELNKEGYGWMINKWKILIHRLPEEYEEVKVETWESSVKRFFAIREYALRDSRGNILAEAKAHWIFMDIRKRIPTRLPKDYLANMNFEGEHTDLEFIRFEKDLDLEWIRDFHVRRLDIDSNNHVNNVNYYGWMLEAVEDTIYENYDLRSLEINYKNEVVYPSEVESWKKNKDLGDYIEITHGIYTKDSNINNALGQTIWQKREKN